MTASRHAMPAEQARALLGLSPTAGLDEARAAFRAAAKLAHPDRPGGDAARFREILEAYRALQAAPALPVVARPRLNATPGVVELTWRVALQGGAVVVVLADNRPVGVSLPPGLRHGEVIRISGEPFIVKLAADDEVMVRGSDLWITANVSPHLLAQGGRIEIDTPLGPREIQATRNAADRRLIRLEGQGLPARADYSQGCLFIRLAPLVESAARAQLRRFAAAWAA